VKMSEPTTLQNDVSLKASVPESGASLESILCTEELLQRPSRPPDYEKENRALVRLVSALADSPSTIFHTLAETIEDITQCDSAGLSLLTRDGKTPHVDGQRFYWPAICGMWNPHVGGGTPRNFGPCGDVLDQNRTLLFTHFERRYPYLMPVSPAAEECLLVPFYVNGKAVGTIWGIMHSDRRKFDAEDDRVMASLGKFASSAYQAWMHIEELNVEVAEREKAEAEVRELAEGLAAKIRRLVEANVVGIMMFNLDGAITEANAAFLHIVQFERDDLDSGRLRWADLTPTEWHATDERAMVEIEATGIVKPYEKEYLRKDGTRVPVMVGGALFEGSQGAGVAFVVDLTQQKRTQEKLEHARRALHATQAELALVTRLTTMGELAASIAHEVNQPLTAVTNNGSACLRLLARGNLDPEVLRRVLEEIVADATRASAVISRIRAFLKKAPTEMNELDVNDVIQEVLALAGHELQNNQVLVDCHLTEKLPHVRADRVQLQQVLLNLVMNGVEAMAGGQPRTLSLESRTDESGNVLVSVRDSGTGFGSEVDRLFMPFFTTKGNGMGMGLPISRSLIESHGGRLWATANSPRGAVFSFTLPASSESHS
jgi:PAS domain S-box-containing protein